MKIDIRDKSPYKAVIDAIRELSRINGYEHMADRIVRIKTTFRGESNQLLLTDDDYYYIWENDWYDGGEVELLGYVDINEVDVPLLKEEKLNENHHST